MYRNVRLSTLVLLSAATQREAITLDWGRKKICEILASRDSQ
jgi:hypothetical protein